MKKLILLLILISCKKKEVKPIECEPAPIVITTPTVTPFIGVSKTIYLKAKIQKTTYNLIVSAWASDSTNGIVEQPTIIHWSGKDSCNLNFTTNKKFIKVEFGSTQQLFNAYFEIKTPSATYTSNSTYGLSKLIDLY